MLKIYLNQLPNSNFKTNFANQLPKMFSKFPKKILLLLIAVVLTTSGFSCKLIPAKEEPVSLTKTIDLSYWGVWDSQDDLEPLFNDFTSLHPNVKISYRRFRYQEYEQALLEAWAEDRGPDLYSLPASWLNKYQSRITPQPKEIRLAFQETKSTLGKKETVTVVKSVPVFSPADVKNKFVDVVYDDAVKDGKIYGLPFSVDTLALFYNRDILDKAGVALPPTNWTELAESVKKITQVNLKNDITRSGVAMGTAANVAQAVDVVSLLMLQNGARLTDSEGKSAFDQSTGSDKDYYPGLEALKFYTDFADPLKEVYTWNKKMPDSLEAFISGKLAMMFGYAYHLPMIKGRAPKLDLGVVAMLQIKDSARVFNYTNYWLETVSHKTKNAALAWGFLNFANENREITKYLKRTKKPTALRALLYAQKDTPELAVFNEQTLTAKRWYRGADALKAEAIMQEMIDDFSGSLDQLKLLQTSVKKINQTL